MEASDLELGQVQLLALTPAAGAFPSSLHRGNLVRLWKDPGSAATFLSNDRAACAVREQARHSRHLDDLFAAGLPHVAWLASLKRDAENPCAFVQVHTFPQEVPLLQVRIGVDEDRLEIFQRVDRNIQSVEEAIRWLMDEFLLVTGRSARAFLSRGREQQEGLGDHFVLHGRTTRVVICVAEEQGNRGLVVARVVRSRGDESADPVHLLSGDIQFLKRDPAALLREADRAQLTAVTMSDESFLRCWEFYGHQEEELAFEKARAIGALPYDHVEPLADGFRFDLTGPLTEGQLTLLAEDDELEANSARPDLAQLTDVSRSAPVKRETSQFRGTVREPPRPGYPCVVLASQSQLPPPSGWLFVCLAGDIRRFDRRRRAQDAIRSGACPMTRLGLLLEGLPFQPGLPDTHPALTEQVRRKVFTREGKPSPPTPNQEAAIHIALNTPDIALIQGPPGTGKTTVINAIIERLNEIADVSRGASGIFLVTGFQHDAVENAISRLDVNELPAIKFGKRDGVDGFNEAERRIDRWRQERAGRVREQLPEIHRPPVYQQLTGRLHDYVQAPGTPADTLRMLDEVAEMVRYEVDPRLTDELSRLREAIRLEAGGGKPAPEQEQRLRAIRGLRTSVEAFADDGPRTAARTLVLLEEELSEPDLALLEEAAGSPALPRPGLIQALAGLRSRLLRAQMPATPVEVAPRARQDVADLLSRLRNDLEARLHRSRQGPDAVVAEYLDRLENDPLGVQMAVISYTPVYAATCQQAAGRGLATAKGPDGLHYDSVLVDEAARSNPLDLFIPMAQARRRLILVGDHRQLPHLIDDRIEKQLESEQAADPTPVREMVQQAIRESLFERLFRQLQARQQQDRVLRTVTLDTQYRMHPVLGDFVSKQFYPESEQFTSGFPSEHYAHALPGYLGRCAAWLDVPAQHGREQPRDRSKMRRAEAEAVAVELKRLIDSDAARSLSFGVITFYAAQVDELGSALAALSLAEPTAGGYRVAADYRDLELPSGKVTERLRVGTVDAFQGKEFDVVFLSVVRSNKHPGKTEEERRKRFGHLMSPNRLCVSMSRQKRLLIVAGDAAMLDGPDAAEAIKELVAFSRLCREQEGGR